LFLLNFYHVQKFTCDGEVVNPLSFFSQSVCRSGRFLFQREEIHQKDTVTVQIQN
jgi:hypothetical protein